MSAGPEEPAPHTGEADVDAAVADLQRLTERPVDEHHDVLAAAHDQLQRSLDPERSGGADPA